MHLRSVVLRNFRCFDELTVRLHPRLTVLVADNGGGKTALLDGIARGLSPLLHRLSSARQRLTGPGFEDTDFLRLNQPSTAATLQDRQSDLFHQKEVNRIAVERPWTPADFTQVILETTDGLRWDNWKPSAQGIYPQEEVGQSDLAKYTTELLGGLSSPTPERFVPVIAYYGALRGWIEVPKRLRRPTTSKIDPTQPTAALFEALRALTDFREMLLWFDAEEANEFRANRDAIRHDPTLFDESPLLRQVRSAIGHILGPGFTNPHFDERHKFVIHSNEGPPLQVSQLSQGYQSMLALGMDFARRLAMANTWLDMAPLPPADPAAALVDKAFELIRELNPDDESLASVGPAWAPAIMLVDEIDLHLHPSWQQRVLADLMRTFPCTQFIVTTHSPQVLSTVKRECIREIARDADGHWIARVPPGDETWGVESSDALRSVFGVDPVPPIRPAAWYRDYLRLIELGTHAEPQGESLRRKLLDLYGPNHPLMLDAERLLRFQEMKRLAASTKG
jgi:predicted ATP-binding protein involved in virulence